MTACQLGELKTAAIELSTAVSCVRRAVNIKAGEKKVLTAMKIKLEKFVDYLRAVEAVS